MNILCILQNPNPFEANQAGTPTPIESPNKLSVNPNLTPNINKITCINILKAVINGIYFNVIINAF